jgi:AcrR family transcriptional regulator
VRKQSVLYWFPSKEALVAAVLDTVADELVVVITAAIRASDDDPLVRIDAVIRAVFGPAVRRPALLGLVRELGRLDPELVERLRSRVAPLVEACVRYLESEMERGRLRQADPRLVAALAYATVTGIATEPEALETVGWTRDLAGLRRLRDELRGFIRAALAP